MASSDVAPQRPSSPAPAPSSNAENRTPEASSPKRRATGSAKSSDKRTKKRRKVNHACVYCQRSHMTCDQQRPCGRCIKRSIGHLCHDEPRETNRRSKPDSDSQPDQTPTADSSNGNLPASAPQLSQPPDPALNMAPAAPTAAPPAPAPLHSQQPARPLSSANVYPSGYSVNPQMYSYNDWSAGNQNSLPDMHFPNFMFNTSELSNEYSLLNDFLNNSIMEDALDDPIYPGDPAQQQQQRQLHQEALQTQTQQQQRNGMFPDQMQPLPASAANGMFAVNPSPGSAPAHPQTNGNSSSKMAAATSNSNNNNAANEKAREKYFMTAADPAGTDTPEERMNRLLQAKYDAGLLKPYNYPKGYQKLQDWMAKNVQPASKERIVYQFNKFRPKFRQRIQKLTDIELVLVEMWFERRLMEYDRIFASMAIPACCWRRTGEIFRGSREMSELLDLPREDFRDGKLALYDILTEDSLVTYWEKFTDIAFEEKSKAILTGCTLKPHPSTPSGTVRRCSFCFTINRDSHGVPTLIVGQFLPITGEPSS